jgi:hypothetical protein
MIRDASESAKYRATLFGLILMGMGLVDPDVALIPLVFGFAIVNIVAYEKYMVLVRRWRWRPFNG